MAAKDTVEITFRGAKVSIPKADEAWFKAKIKAEQSVNQETKKEEE